VAQADLAEEIEAALRETGVESSWLKLEITETVTAEALIHAEPWRVQGARALSHR
jgi:EAL domain-containing protein (putative c-di-GMP-specific phosphodiesterase class I)